MNAITIRNLSEAASRELEARAVENGTTAEAEAERILQKALTEIGSAKNGASGLELLEAFQKLGRDYPEFLELDFSRDQTLAGSVSFE